VNNGLVVNCSALMPIAASFIETALSGISVLGMTENHVVQRGTKLNAQRDYAVVT
jgi:hypothetical protein